MFKTNDVLLKSLLDQVQDGRIQLPDFQRGWVWDDDHIKGLLASISKGFPIGAVMTLSSGSDIKFRTRPIEGVDSAVTGSPESFLLDGQQRLTSLYQALRHPGPVDTNDNRRQRIKRWYYVDMMMAVDDAIDREEAFISVPEDRIVKEDFGRTIVRDLSTPEHEYESHMIPTERLMDPMDWIMDYLQYWEVKQDHPSGNAHSFVREFRQSVEKNFTDYQLPVINLDKETPKQAVCTVFEKVNTGGVVLNVFELATASFAADAEEFSLRDDWERRKGRMYSFAGVLQGVGGDNFLQVVALLKTQEDRRRAASAQPPMSRLPQVSCRKQDILDLLLSDYLHWADKVEQGFIDAAKFLHSQFVIGKGNVPYNTQLVPLAALYVELGRELLPAVAKGRLEHWFWSGIFTESYGGAIETQLGLDLTEVADYVRGGAPPTLVAQANFIPERLLTLRTRVSAAYKGLYALQMKSGAADWKTGQPLSLANYHDENIDIHHIFPVAWCEKAKPAIPARLYNSVINKTPVDAFTNKSIGGLAPSHYLTRLRRDMTPELLDQVLVAHWVDPRTLEQDNFDQTFIYRGEELLSLIGKAMGRNLGSGRQVFEQAVQWNDTVATAAAYRQTLRRLPSSLIPSKTSKNLTPLAKVNTRTPQLPPD